MFNDQYGLTQAVLDRLKTKTRRIAPDNTPIGCWEETEAKVPFKVGEIVAIAQSYASILDELEDPKNFYCMEHWEAASPQRARYAGLCYQAGGTNKMFVRADLMPHQIQFTDLQFERLQDISDEDCLKEGIRYLPEIGLFYFEQIEKHNGNYFYTPRQAFAALINKVSGKGTWERNPFVFVYEFELIK